MKRSLFCLFLIQLFFMTSLQAAPTKAQGNDTLIEKDYDKNNLFKYLRGSWNVKGTWQVLEGQGKVKYSSRASLSGTETYTPILNGHFLQKTMNSKVSYYSRDYGKKVNDNFSTLTLYTFNENLGNFLFWYYDSAGGFMDAKGSFSQTEDEYTFKTQGVDDQGKTVETLHVISIVDSNQYRWEVKLKTGDDYEWKVGASGTSTRSK